MKERLVWLASLVAAFAVPAYSQGTFQNLDFEAAHDLPAPGNIVATSNALPGWSAFSGTNQLSSILYYGDAGGALVSVGLESSNAALAGNFSVVLGGGAISQLGLIPTGTESLLFEAVLSPYFGMSVSLGGCYLSCSAIYNGVNVYGQKYTAYAADISGLAGQTKSLAFAGTGFLDDIQFSSQPSPEPPAPSLIFVAGGILVSLRVRRRRPARAGSN
ncbi:MAG: hypothetical protein KGJ88_14015 [Verrucomicrobiota bacterium]|nr:hypothetical protein [Verrucomicrobiota bacterium]